LTDLAYKFVSTYIAIHCEFLKIESAYYVRQNMSLCQVWCILKYLIKKTFPFILLWKHINKRQ